jgi:hypothetical protein
MKGGHSEWRTLSSQERSRTLDAYDDLWLAAADARSEGFSRWEPHEAIYAPARRLGVWVWPALADRIMSEVEKAVPHPVSSRW